MPDFKQSVMKPFISFLKEVYRKRFFSSWAMKKCHNRCFHLTAAEVRATFSLSAQSRSPSRSPLQLESLVELPETIETPAANPAPEIEIGNRDQESLSASSHIAPQAAVQHPSSPPELGHRSLLASREALPVPTIVIHPPSLVASPSFTELNSSANVAVATATVDSTEMHMNAYSNASGTWTGQQLTPQWNASNACALTDMMNLHPLMASSESLFYDISLPMINLSVDGLPNVDLDIPNLALPPASLPAAPSTQEASGSESNSSPALLTPTSGLMTQPAVCAVPPTMALQRAQVPSSEALPGDQDEQGSSPEVPDVNPIEAVSHSTPIPTASRRSHRSGQDEESATPSSEQGRPKRRSKKPARADATPPWQQNTLSSVEGGQAGRMRQVVSEKQNENENDGRTRKKLKRK